MSAPNDVESELSPHIGGLPHTRRVAVVTGAASGIGRATAELLVRSGYAVVAADLDAVDVDGVESIAADVSTPEGNAAIVSTALDTYGGLNVLILNAGVVDIGPLEHVTAERIDRILAVNLRGVVLGLQAALPALERAKHPAVVTVASISAQGEPSMAVYAASKGGVISLSLSAAAELGPHGIRVNCVCPGPVVTGMTQPVMDRAPQVAETVRRNVPLGRLGDPREIAEVIAFLASPAASFVHGAVIPVDGGVTASSGQYPVQAPMEVAA